MTLLVFGARIHLPGVHEATVPLVPDDIDAAAKAVGEWCADEGWPEGLVGKVQLVMEEKLMNVYDHGFDERYRLREVVNIRLRRLARGGGAELTVWDTGTPEPSIQVAAGDTATAFELKNREMSGHGRGRLMVRELCDGVERVRHDALNETIYYIKGEEDAPAPGREGDGR